MQTAQPVELRVDGPIARLTLNRPEKRNALSEAMWSSLAALAAYVEEEPDIKVLVLCGAGGHFCAGADIDEFPSVYADTESANAYADLMQSALTTLDRCRKPTLAAVEGACHGAGMMLALACDLRLAAPGARFCLPPARLGIAYPFDDVRRAVRVLGEARTRELLLTARDVFAEEAQAIGLAQLMVSDTGSFDEAVTVHAERLAGLSQASLHASKAMLAALAAGQAEEDEAMRRLFLDCVSGPDFAEALKARTEGRTPAFPWKAESLFDE